MKLFENWHSKDSEEELEEKKIADLDQRIKSLQENRDAILLGMRMETHRDDAVRLQEVEDKIKELEEELEDLKGVAA